MKLFEAEAEANAMRIARKLFWINLVPAVVASVVIFFGLCYSLPSFFSNSDKDYSNLIMLLLLICGVICEVVYFNQAKYLHIAQRKSGWLYSILLNSAFIGFELRPIFSTDPLGAKITWVNIAILIYPITFAIFSFIALYQSKSAIGPDLQQ